jgi:spore coat polysaccharide biosynthesis predicted glycosyltransferase SpsG
MRCRAIAEAADARGLQVGFVLRGGEPATAVLDPWDTVSMEEVGPLGPDAVVVVDDYDAGQDEIDRLRADGALVALLDDRPHLDRQADVAIVPSHGHVVATPGTAVWSGPQYAPLRSDVRRRRRRPRPGTEKLLVTFGGSDPRGRTSPVVRLLANRTAFTSLVVVLGPLGSTQGWDELRALPGVDLRTSPASMAEVLAECDAAISAAGSTLWELLCIGVPTLAVRTADNQDGVYRLTTGAQACLGAGYGSDDEGLLHLVDQLAQPATQAELGRRGQALVDGRGADRIVQELILLLADRSS